MEIIIMVLLSAISIFVCSKLAKVTKVPTVIFLMLIGVLIGSYGLDIAKYLPSMSLYSSIAIVILFLVSGYGLDVDAIKTSGKKTFGLSSLPVLGEGLIVGCIAWIVLSILPVFNEPSINFAAVVAIMLVFAMSSPAIIIPFNMQGKQRGINASVFDELTVASVLDNFIPFPIVLIFLKTAYAITGGEGFNFLDVLIQSILLTVFLIITFIVSYFIAKLIAKPINMVNNNFVVALLLIGFTIFIYFITGPIGASFGIIIGFGIGMGYNVSTEKPKKFAVLGKSQKIYGMTLMPIVFIYVGTQIQVDQLVRPVTVLAFAIITVSGIIIKGFIAKKFLAKQGSSQAEGQYAAYGFAAKGIILINISLIFGTGLQANNLDYILQMMYMLAAISIIISVPYSSVKLAKQLDVLEEDKTK